MSNPKYADLPGIARDQPDVYETNDLPESDQSHSLSEVVTDHSDSVEQLKVSATEAYEKFKGKTLSADNVDFTDNICRLSRTGYNVGEWETLDSASKEKETPLQAYNRLQCEMKELLDKISELKESSEDNAASQVSSAVLADQVQRLQKQLQDLHMEEVLGSEAIQEMADPLGSVFKKILLQVENVKNKPPPEKKASPVSGVESTGALSYELYINPEHSKLKETEKMAELEQRLKSLEAVIGNDNNKLKFLTSNTDDKNVISAISLLSSKVNILDPTYLEQVENRLFVLQQCMQQAAEKKQQIDDAEKQSKVNELYDLARKVEGMSNGLPQVVQRLVALKELHEQALQFSKALTQLSTMQQQLASSLKNSETLLKAVQDAFIKNTEVIEKNVNSLNSRITALNK